MTSGERKRAIKSWREASEVSFASAQSLYNVTGDNRGALNRAYYAAYQACAAAAVAHGDEKGFPSNWNNPSHEQLPDLIRNNGDLTLNTRERVSRNLGILRRERETADYKPWRSVENDTVLKCLSLSSAVLSLLRE